MAAGLVLLAGSASARADAPPPHAQQSQFETYWGASLARDCGFSRRLPSGQALWIFCDTAVYSAFGTQSGFITGSTAAEGTISTGLVPTSLVEVPTPPASLNGRSPVAGPSPFLPNPTHLTRADGSACTPSSAGYPAAWPTGVAQEPNGSSKLVVTYSEVCVDNGSLFVEGAGILEYDAATNTVVSGPTEVFRAQGPGAQLPAQERLGSPVFSNNVLYLFSSVCDASVYGVCTSGRVFVANVLGTPASWQNGSKYYFWYSPVYPSWSQDSTRAQSVLPGATPMNVTVDTYDGKGMALVEQTSIGGGYRVWTAPTGRFVGPWTQRSMASSLAGCTGGTGLNLCRALTGHPELSTSDQLLMSYYDPALNHVVVVGVPW